MKTEKLIHKATGVSQDIPTSHVGAYLANGWARSDKLLIPVDGWNLSDKPEDEPQRGKRK